MLSRLRVTYSFNVYLLVLLYCLCAIYFKNAANEYPSRDIRVLFCCSVVYCMYYRRAHDSKLDHIDSDPTLQGAAAFHQNVVALTFFRRYKRSD